MPKVSVLLPVYNGEKYISEAINSILSQTFEDFELLILNDGSTDKTVELIEQFDDNRIRLFTNPQNLKLIATLNRGIELAKGEYIARMDADDISLAKRFEKQVSFLDNNIEYVAVGTNCRYFGDQHGNSNLYLENDDIRLAVYFESPMIHPSIMMRASVLKSHDIRYNSTLVHMEDWGLWKELMNYGKICNLSEILLEYRVSGHNITVANRNTMETRYMEMYVRMMPDIIERFNKEDAVSHYQVATGYFKNLSAKDLANYLRRMELAFLKKGFKHQLLSALLKKKVTKLVYAIADHERGYSFRIALRYRALTIGFLRYWITKFF